MGHYKGLRVIGIVATALVATACSGTADLPSAPTAPAPVMSATPPPTPPPVPTAPSTARYRVTFDATWTAQTHPQDAPVNPHFSPLIGGTHTAAAIFWQEGALATEGIRRMAERGAINPLDDEIRAAIAAGTGERVFTGDAVSSPKTTSFEFDMSSKYPRVTLVTMVAPSPDWFVGVSGLALYDQETWAETVTVPLYPWDAGTDSGPSFDSPDRETVPRQPIARITGAPLGAGGRVAPLGTFTFTKIQ